MTYFRPQASRVGGRPPACTLVLLLAISSAPAAQGATDATPAAAPAASAAAMQPASPASMPISPHARAARERALAQPDAAASGIRVSPFTDRRKPHKPLSAR